jgi:hypothetical protein
MHRKRPLLVYRAISPEIFLLIHQVIDISASEGHIVPTSIAERNGSLYVGNLNLFPINPQWARILTISRPGFEDYDPAPGFETDGARIVNSKARFTTVVAVDFGPDGLLYVLELSNGAGFPTPGLGEVVRVKRSGEIEPVVTGLVVPTGMTSARNNQLISGAEHRRQNGHALWR